MTIQDGELQELLGLLGNTPIPVSERERRPEHRRRVISVIESCAARVHESRRLLQQWRRRAALLSVAACIVLVSLGWATLRFHARPNVDLEPRAGRLELVDGRAQFGRAGHYTSVVTGAYDLGRYDTVTTTAASRARLVLASDIRVDLFPETRLRLGEVADRSSGEVWLLQGKARFEVAKRTPTGSFSVHAPDVDVTVVGTAFTVHVRQLATGSQTSVAVAEGVVLVHKGTQITRLTAGQAWSSPREADAPTTNPPPVSPLPSASVVTTNNIHRSDDAAQSTLHAENAAFSEAMSAKRRGDDAKALAQLDAFLARYPASPLAQNARVERFRLLKHLGRATEASSAALEYMSQDPNGFARSEARDLVAPPTTSEH